MFKIVMADDTELLLALDDSFIKRADCELFTAATGAEALTTVREERPELVLLDVAMPETSGFDVCRAIKSDPELAGIPVVLCGPAEELPRMREARADGAVPRPISPEQLLQTIHDQLGIAQRESTRRASVIRVDYYVGDRDAVAYTKDISEGGLFLKTRDPLPPETGLQLIFDLPAQANPTIRADGQSAARMRDADPATLADDYTRGQLPAAAQAATTGCS